MRQPIALVVVLVWSGSTLLLSGFHWFRRQSLAERLRPYVDGTTISGTDETGTGAIVRVLGPISQDAGAALARAAGVDEDLERRLARIHSTLDPTAFRLRQAGWVIAAGSLAVMMSFLLTPPLPLLLLLLIGSPLLAFLLVESDLSRRSDHWKRSVLLELPVVSEQMGMLLSAGYSLGASLARLARRSTGCTSRDLARVVARIGHGVDEVAALREWADTLDLPAVHRLVGVLSLDREAGDLGHLITNEARAVRAELHRDLVERVETRGQQVWIPVTVATLVPGLLFLAVPFIDAMQLFAGN